MHDAAARGAAEPTAKEPSKHRAPFMAAVHRHSNTATATATATHPAVHRHSTTATATTTNSNPRGHRGRYLLAQTTRIDDDHSRIDDDDERHGLPPYPDEPPAGADWPASAQADAHNEENDNPHPSAIHTRPMINPHTQGGAGSGEGGHGGAAYLGGPPADTFNTGVFGGNQVSERVL